MVPSGANPEKAGRRLALAGALSIGGAALLIGCLALGDGSAALNASLRGVSVWWEVLFPALFPFFVLSELLLGFGIVHFMGTLLDPFMRPLFRLPGAGGFIVSMGFVSGYPVGARLTSRLVEQKLVTRDEGERLVAMTTTSDPIFLIGAVCVGFFGSLHAAPVLAAAHYSGALLLGFASRFGKRRDNPAVAPAEKGTARSSRWRSALAAMHRARMEDGRPFGVQLQQALQSSLGLMMIVGGLVVFFSAALDLLTNGGLLVPLRSVAAQLLSWFGLPPQLSEAYMHGAFEVTLGAKASAADTAIPLVDRVAVAAFVLSWAGLSVHAQVAGLMSGAGWRYLPFARTRFLHGLLAMALVYAFWPWLYRGEAAAGFAQWPSLLPAWTNAAPETFGIRLGWEAALIWLPLLFVAALVSLVVLGTAAIGARRAWSRFAAPRPR
ncbi:nucleoside recognition domain-containing protein [Cohnella cellulosilytica]|uniref:nucleoside recognition domain-containing protein n=1 Tax=Cohnella cellulosilytica TaxID=986710 RepID=UPI00366C632E